MARLTIIALALLFSCMLTPFVVAQMDSDGDGVPDNVDNCPLIGNPNQEDANNDGEGDVCDCNSDTDADAVVDCEDNCPLVNSATQEDMDGDGLGDVCDLCPTVPLGPEVCDGLDNDCDSFIDEDLVSNPTNCGIGACSATGSTSCVGGALEDSCTPGSPGPEVCDALDNDCDGTIDEDGVCDCNTDTDSDAVVDCEDNCPLTGNQFQEDADGDGLGDVCDNCPTVPLGPEVCDGLDNDCDGNIDEDLVPNPTNCGIGACSATGSTSCVSGVLEDSCTPGSPEPEVCDSLDNDCDGLTDCEDEDCFDDLICLAPRQISIPTLSQWGLITMAGILGVVGFMVIRRRKVTVQKD